MPRLSFIRRTYAHLMGAIGVFAVLCFTILQLDVTRAAVEWLTTKGSFAWLAVLGIFMVVGMAADRMALPSMSKPVQYAGLALYTVAEAMIFTPMLYMANAFAPGAIGTAAVVSAIVFAGLTVVVFMTKRDFSFLRSFIIVGGLVAIGAIVAGAIFGVSLGLWFSVAMVLLAAGAILYNTSNVLHHYPTDAHVAAALSLFAAVALLFWYVLRIVMAFTRD